MPFGNYLLLGSPKFPLSCHLGWLGPSLRISRSNNSATKGLCLAYQTLSEPSLVLRTLPIFIWLVRVVKYFEYHLWAIPNLFVRQANSSTYAWSKIHTNVKSYRWLHLPLLFLGMCPGPSLEHKWLLVLHLSPPCLKVHTFCATW